MFFNRTCLIFVLLCLGSLFARGQKKVLVTGEVAGISRGDLYLIPLNIDKKYYGKNSLFDSAEIIGNRFKIIRNVKETYECAYRILIVTDSAEETTGIVFLGDKEETNIIIDTIDEYVSPVIKKSDLQTELKYDYDIFFSVLVKKIKSLDSTIEEINCLSKEIIPQDKMPFLTSFRDDIILQGDSLLLAYTQSHSNSNVALWKLVERFGGFGYKNKYQKIFNTFKSDIAKSTIFKILNAEFSEAMLLSINSNFPAFKLKNFHGEATVLEISKYKNKFTLIDFWFSSCSPCIQQFKLLKSIYDMYNDWGFSIIGISVDSKEKINSWREAVYRYAVNWPQFLDEGGLISDRVKISSFPTNFLLDSSGKIIEKNIELAKLTEFLKSHFKVTN